jgi:hypothetical protein
MLALDFAFLERDCLQDNRMHGPNRTSIGPLMIDWHRHQSVHLRNCAITLRELRPFISLSREKPSVLGPWHVYLLDGTWAEAVDILRRGVLSGQYGRDSASRLFRYHERS